MKQKVEERIIAPKEIIIGEANAKVKLVEYGDYESAESVKAHEVVLHLLEEYAGKIAYTFRHFPLTRIHQRSFKAAEAAIGAAQEGKFWEMHDLLFKNKRNLGKTSLKGYAREEGVSSKHFLEDLMNSKYGWYVREDQMQGADAGVKDVSTFFINGIKFEGKPTFNNLSAAIEAALKSRKKIKQAA